MLDATWLSALAAGMALGVGAAAPPGPVNLEILRRTSRGGWWAGATVGLGAVTVDVVLAILLTAGVLEAVDRVPGLRLALTIVGGLLLLWLGTGALRSAFTTRDRSVDALVASRPTAWAGYATGLLLCSTSPYQAAFWLTGVLAVMKSMGDAPASGIILGVFFATLAWVVTFTTLVATASATWLGRWIGFLADLLGGAILIGFGILVLSSLLR
jgi:L-lysine exporter family protein LysE/ArgO